MTSKSCDADRLVEEWSHHFDVDRCIVWRINRKGQRRMEHVLSVDCLAEHEGESA